MDNGQDCGRYINIASHEFLHRLLFVSRYGIPETAAPWEHTQASAKPVPRLRKTALQITSKFCEEEEGNSDYRSC
jgi:hypothetical protein